MNQYSRDEAGRIRHAKDVAIVRQAFKGAPADAVRYRHLRLILPIELLETLGARTSTIDAKLVDKKIDSLMAAHDD